MSHHSLPVTHHSLIVGHRGAAGRAPENTLAGIRRAWELGADVVEMDIHLTLDGHPVVLHDESLDRTTNGLGLVAARSLAEVRRLDAGAWFGEAFRGERVPALEEALTEGATAALRTSDTTPRPEHLRWLIELKRDSTPSERLVERALAAIQAAGAMECLRLISFDEEILAESRRQAPELPRGIIGALEPDDLLAAAERQECGAVHLAARLLTPDLLATLRATGQRVNIWTLNDAEAIASAMELGVDEVTTDVPDVALAVRAVWRPTTP